MNIPILHADRTIVADYLDNHIYHPVRPVDRTVRAITSIWLLALT
jgi:hypothetical protein